MSSSSPSQSPSPEAPFSVSHLNKLMADYIARLGSVWVEGQVTQASLRGPRQMSFLVLRDLAAQSSVQVKIPGPVLAASGATVAEGAHILLGGRMDYYQGRGQLSLLASEVRAVGLGELLARIEQLRSMLAAENLFDPRLKRPLPFLPRTIGLITGAKSAAERDVLQVAQSRWPAVSFRVINTPVQGPMTVPKVIEALDELEHDPDVDVIIVARGGGSVEDLLPFSDETLVRHVVRLTTPVVSAIGHEPDHPLLDDVADVRAATPTDAAKKTVPDAFEEGARVSELRHRAAAALRAWVDRESRILADVRARPGLARPDRLVSDRAADIERGLTMLRHHMRVQLDRETAEVSHLTARLGALGPAQTLARGYAVIQARRPDGDTDVVSTVDQAPPGTQLRIRVTDGVIDAAALGARRTAPASATDTHPPHSEETPS